MAGPVVNPAAVLKSLEEQYAQGLRHGLQDQSYYDRLYAQVDALIKALTAEASMPGPARDTNGPLIDMGSRLLQQVQGTVENLGVIGLDRGRQEMVDSGSIDRKKLDAEIQRMFAEGATPESILETMMSTGQYSLDDMQYAAFNAPRIAGDMAKGTPDTSGEIPAPGDGTSDFKPYEKVPTDTTDPRTEFQNGFAQFTRGLETSLNGKTPQIGALTARYNDLFNSYIGEVEARKARGEEPANVWKEEFVNIGKSTDAQYDQKTDRQQLRTVRPTISAFDWILKNVDPEDVYASTPQSERPGGRSTTGGFRGYVTRRG